MDELIRIAANKGFEVFDNPGRGNCMYYALSDQLKKVKGIQISHTQLREELVQFLKENPRLVSH